MNTLKSIAFALYLVFAAIVEGIPVWFEYSDFWRNIGKRNKV